MMRLLVIGCAVLLGVLTPLRFARAQGVVDISGSMGDEEAKQHFKVGSALYQGGRFAEAALEWEKAYALSKKPQLLYNLYVAYRDASDLPNAISSLRRYLDGAELEPDARVNLQARLTSMEEANNRAGATAVAAPAVSPAPSPVAPPPSPTPAPVRDDRTAARGGASPVAYVLAIGGGALIAGGVVTGIVTSGKVSSIDDDCPAGICPAGYGLEDKRDDVNNWRALSIALVSTGVVAGVLGTVLLLSADGAPEQSAASSPATTAALGCGPSECIASVHGVF